jgi:uncharacterized protein (TIGR02266 family)
MTTAGNPQNRSEQSRTQQERRGAERVAINREFGSIDDFIAEYATNISNTGCFIRSKHPLPVGTRVNLRFTVIADDLEIVEGTGEVVRVVRPPHHGAGMGVRFLRLSEKTRDFIARLAKANGG